MIQNLLASWRSAFERTGPSARLAGAQDLVLAGLLVAIVVMMLVPLPAFALDFLIALNLAASVALLLVAVYVSDASRLAALPSMLLLATLFRLSLSVSTTRLVLLYGDAGRVVEAFGRVVVAGNLVVGAVVFLVLALVQFVVIAKGSERVAEVAARFTLDGLPGKQMSIDADMRAGTITLEEAQERRRALERESQLFGALDGAMKFVKGDAIAGLVIVAINIVGGLAVGVLQRGMSLGAAASHYTVLTVGDGLAAQLPALLVSTTAGLVVTRVPDGAGGRNLGGDIVAQIAAQPRALAVTAALLGLVALVPGLPAVPFLALSALAGAAAYGGRRKGAPSKAPARRAPLDDAALVLTHATPVRLALGARAFEAVEGGLEGAVRAMRLRLLGDLGLRAPEVEPVEDGALRPFDFEVLVGGIAASRGSVPDLPRWIAASTGELEPLGIHAVAHAGAGRSRSWASEADARRAEEAGYRTGDAAAFVAERLEAALRAHADELVGVQEARELADALESTHPALVAEVLPRLVSLSQLAEVLRRLVREEVSVRDTRAVFEAVAAHAPHERDPVALAELVRSSLRRQITAAVTGGRPNLPVYVLDRRAEEGFREAARYAQPGAPLGIDPDLARVLLERLRALEARPRDVSAPRPVLVVPREIRRHVRAAVEGDLPALPVLAYQDLMPTVVLQPIAAVGPEAHAEAHG